MTYAKKLPHAQWPGMRWAGLIAGPAVALLVWCVLPESYGSGADVVVFTEAGRATASVAVWMAVWWLTEAVHVSITALLPVVLFPLVGASSVRDAAAPYGNEMIFLFMGGFILSLSMQRWGLHNRIALLTLRLVGTKPVNIIAGFMAVTALLSMWVSNTATVVMMLPIALSVVNLLGVDTAAEANAGDDGNGNAGSTFSRVNFSLTLMLGIAYAASIGGIGTIIGSPPNLLAVSFIRDHLNTEISFVQWMGFGLPLVLCFLPLTWALLVKVVYPVGNGRIEGGERLAREGYAALGPMKPGEWVTLAVFLTAVGLWIFRPVLQDIVIGGMMPLKGLSDTGVAMLAAMALFVIPVDLKKREFIMDWETARTLPWGILILFGGGLSLARGIEANGVGNYLGFQVTGMQGLPVLVVVIVVVALVVFLTELTSNMATTATLLPILASIAPGLGVNPFLLIIPAAISASCAFIMPVATPPNAIVYSSGQVSMAQMSKAGVWLNIIAILLITALAYGVIIPLLGR